MKEQEDTIERERIDDVGARSESALLCRIRSFANLLVDTGNELRLVTGEQDETKDPSQEAATFLKLDGKRLGRDLELYNFMARVAGQQEVITRILEELVMPLKTMAPAAFTAGINGLRGFRVFGDRQGDWDSLLTELEA